MKSLNFLMKIIGNIANFRINLYKIKKRTIIFQKFIIFGKFMKKKSLKRVILK